MKKAFAVILTAAALICFAACEKKAVEETSVPLKTLIETEEITVFADNIDTRDGVLLIRVKIDKDDDNITKSAWMGICPRGEYKKEEKAEEAVLTKGTVSSSGMAEVPFAELAAGDYTLVFCGENDGGDVISSMDFIIEENRSIYIP